MDQPQDIDPIVKKYIREESLTPEEATALRQWIAGADGRKELLESLRSDPAWTKENLGRIEDIHHEHIWDKLESRISSEGFWELEPSESSDEPAVVPFVAAPAASKRWWGYLIAASLLVIAGGSAFWLLHRPVLAPVAVAKSAAHDVPPGGDRATLTLANGSTINLDSTANGVLASQGNTLVAKLDGHLAYNAAASASLKPTTPTFNVLSTPRAGQFTLSLPDRTKVWLNNASSLRYPVWFTGATREVELTGEAYFEVAKDAAHPFKVTVRDGAAGADGGAIEVLGTSFNIMAYGDESSLRTTLIDGGVRYVHGSDKAVLKAAEQSVCDAMGNVKTVSNVNVDNIIAWKNGYFVFDHANLETTMRQLARWYDISVEYQGKIPPQEFMGKIQRNMPLSTILGGLESESIHFKLEGRKLMVMP